MSDLLAQLVEGDDGELRVGAHRIRVEAQGVFGPQRRLGVVLRGYTDGSPPGPEDYLNDLLLIPAHREATYALIDHLGLLICKELRSSHPSYREVRGRSSRGRLSQGEYYHHDGCSGPTKPRVVEIRFPHQEVGRGVATAVAPFPDSVFAMLRLWSQRLGADEEIRPWHDRLERDGSIPADSHDLVQGLVTRALRRHLSAEQAREFFRQVDEEIGAYRETWQMGESRLICNAHPRTGQVGTMQHRRAYLSEHRGGVANGTLVKRWPAEELD